jgi:hypothetical protein
VADEHYIVMTVKYPTCKTKQKIHLAVTIGDAHTSDQTILCINCTNHFKVTALIRFYAGRSRCRSCRKAVMAAYHFSGRTLTAPCVLCRGTGHCEKCEGRGYTSNDLPPALLV